MKRKECRKAGLLLALTVLALRGTASEPPAVARMEGPKLLRSLDPDEFNFKFDENSYFVLRLTIDTSGHVGTVEVTNRGFVNRETLYTATQYAKTLRFKPAARDGVPIETKVLLPFEFQMRDSEPIRSEYREQERRVIELLNAGDAAGADFHAEWMLSEVVKSRYEYVALQGTLAATNFTMGNYARALEAAEFASRRTIPAPRFQLHQKVPKNSPMNYVANNPPSYIQMLLDLKLQAATRQGLALEALETYYELAGLIQMNPEDPRVAFAAKVSALLESDAPLAGKRRLGENGLQHDLFRRNFTFDNLKGKIRKISLNCQGQFRDLEYAPGVEWAIPKSWDDCSLWVDGDPGTSFNIVEFADATPAPPPPSPPPQ